MVLATKKPKFRGGASLRNDFLKLGLLRHGRPPIRRPFPAMAEIKLKDLLDFFKSGFISVVARSPRFLGDAATQNNPKTAVSGMFGWPRRLKKEPPRHDTMALSLFAKVEVLYA